jgi:hypothetical protein
VTNEPGQDTIYFLAALGLVMTGCNNPITDFVKDSQKIPGEIAGGSLANGPTALKVSPGQLKAAGANSAALANVTATNQVLSSPGASGVFSISRSRSSQ